jgi:hypothetical protein
MKNNRAIYGMFLFIMVTTGCETPVENRATGDRIQPYAGNPAFWQYKGQPVMLIGGSSDDNLFQHLSPDLDDELDLIKEYGGNYVRCSMSSRDSGNVYPFYLDPETQLYDLDRWDDEFWRRFDYFLKATHDRGMIVQIEIWETYDFYTRDHHRWDDGTYPWDRNPFNPDRNINYTVSESGMPVIFRSTGGTVINPFFATVLAHFDEVPLVLGYQQKFVDQLMSISLKYDHVLYCIDNETNADPEWGIYWANYIKEKAEEQNIQIEVTEAWDSFDPTDRAVKEARVQNPSVHFYTRRASVSNTLNRPDVYSYLEISNNNFQTGEVHYKTSHYVWNKVQESGIIRPINNVKIYGGGGVGWTAGNQEGVERFWRNVFAGSAAVRFHRPPWGVGSSEIALTNIRSMRMLTDSIDIFRSVPANELLGERQDNEAYCLANHGKEYILYFPAGGNVNFDVRSGNYEVAWLNISKSEWQNPVSMALPGNIQTPGDGQWGLLIKRI